MMNDLHVERLVDVQLQAAAMQLYDGKNPS
jgi:hypothetical protein